jgi:glucose/arabinose dehydrogenase
VVKNGTELGTPFLTVPDVDTTGEGGLLSVAFPPDYAASGRFYVFLTPTDANPGVAPHAPIEIREYTRSAGDSDVAEPSSAREVLEIPHPSSINHYGATLQFGPDGLMYAGTGDGGGTGDPANNAEDTFERLGKILRLDPSGDDPGEFTVPPTNPFANGVGGDPLVFGYGLRNPFRFSFDRVTGDLIIGDVGQNAFEEVDFSARAQGGGRGADYGWNTCEGFVEYPNPAIPCNRAGATLPAYAYPHAANPCSGSITGGVVVRDPALPSLANRYLYAEFCKGYVRSVCLPSGTDVRDLGLGTVTNVTAFGEDASGRVVVVQIGGAVSRLTGTSPVGACPLTAAPARPAASTTRPFTFDLGGALRQRPLRSGNVGVRVRCQGACSSRALGRLSLKLRGKRIGLRQALGRRASAGTLTLRLRLTARARRALRRALRGRRPVRAALTVRVRDGAGRLSLRQRTVRLAR